MSLKAWETTGVDVSRDRIVELAATQGHDLAHLPGASFSEVVRVPEEIRRSASAQAAAAVHGITDEEIALGTTFPQAWARFLGFVEACSNNMIQESEEDTDEEPLPPRPLNAQPTVCCAAHNGVKFDFAVLLFECQRHRLSVSPFRHWLFVDTLHILECTKAELGGACLKLQCLIHAIADTSTLRAHRALDDCICLRHVVHQVACKLDCSVTDLLRRFAYRWDEQSSLPQIAALVED